MADPHNLISDLLGIGKIWTITDRDDNNLQPNDYNWVQHGFASKTGWMRPNSIVHLVVVYVVQESGKPFYKIGQTSTYERPVLARIMEQNTSNHLKLVGLAICAQRRRDTGHSYRATRPNHDTTMRNALVLQGVAHDIITTNRRSKTEIEWVRINDLSNARAEIVRHCGQRGHAWLDAPSQSQIPITSKQYISVLVGGDTRLTTDDPGTTVEVVACANYDAAAVAAEPQRKRSRFGTREAGAGLNARPGARPSLAIPSPSPSTSTSASANTSTSPSASTSAGASARPSAILNVGATDSYTDNDTMAEQSNTPYDLMEGREPSPTMSMADLDFASQSPSETFRKTLYGKVLLPPSPTQNPARPSSYDVITITNNGGVSTQTSIDVPENENQFYYTQGRTRDNTWLAVVAPQDNAPGKPSFTAVWLDRDDSDTTRFDVWKYNSLTAQNTIIHGSMSEEDYNFIFTDIGLEPSQDSAGGLSLGLGPQLRLRLRLRHY